MKHKFGASPSIVAHARTPLLLVLLLLSGSGSLAVAQNPRASGFRLQEATIADIHAAFAAGTLTCRQLVGLYLDRILREGLLRILEARGPVACEDAWEAGTFAGSGCSEELISVGLGMMPMGYAPRRMPPYSSI